MGISHPFSDEFEVSNGGGVSPERGHSPPPPASCCPGADYLEHEVSRMDTLAGIAIKYGVEISDIKRVNSLVSDRQMFAHKSLLIPLPGRHTPSPVRFNGSGQRMKRAWTPNHQQNKDTTDSFDSLKYKYPEQRTSLAMSTLQRYYGLASQKGELMECNTEMSSYGNGSFQHVGSEPLPKVFPATDAQNISRHWNSESPVNGFQLQNGANGIKSNGATKAKKDGSVRRRQKVEADPLSNTTDIQEDAADPIKIVKSLFPRPISGFRLNMDISSQDSVQNGNPSLVNGFNSVRKSSSTPSFAESENGTSIWSSSKWTLKPEAFTRPFIDGLPKPMAARRNKAALD